jgi:hypothetical protein
MISTHSTATTGTANANNDNNSSVNCDKELTMDLTNNSNNDHHDHHLPCFPDPDNELLLSMAFPHHSLMVKYVYQCSTTRGFLTRHQYKQCFTVDEYVNYFPGGTYYVSSVNQTKKSARRGIFIVPPNPKVAQRMWIAVLGHTMFGM